MVTRDDDDRQIRILQSITVLVGDEIVAGIEECVPETFRRCAVEYQPVFTGDAVEPVIIPLAFRLPPAGGERLRLQDPGPADGRRKRRRAAAEPGDERASLKYGLKELHT